MKLLEFQGCEEVSNILDVIAVVHVTTAVYVAWIRLT